MTTKPVTLAKESIPDAMRKGIAALKESESVWKYESLNFDMM